MEGIFSRLWLRVLARLLLVVLSCFLTLASLAWAEGSANSSDGSLTPKDAVQSADGAFATEDLSRSVQLLAARAEEGDAESQFLLGLYFRNTEPALTGGAVDYAKVVDLYGRAAAQGHIKANFALGRLYDQGLGVEENIPRSIELYTVAAEAGHVEAMVWLGALYGATGDARQTFKWSKRAADLGNTEAHNQLGTLYQIGAAVTQDHSLAMEHYRIAADSGSCAATMNIGGMHYNGDGVDQDSRKAEQWFEKARLCEDEYSTFIAETSSKYLRKIRDGVLPTPQSVAELKDKKIDGTEIVAALAILAVLAAANEAGSDRASAGPSHDFNPAACVTTFGMHCDPGLDTAIAGIGLGLW